MLNKFKDYARTLNDNVKHDKLYTIKNVNI